MYVMRLLWALLFLLHDTNGQNCNGPTITLSSQDDVSSISACSTISATITISPQATGSIAINGPVQIAGNLLYNNVASTGGLTSLTSKSITSIQGTLRLFNLKLLSAFSFPDLASIGEVSVSSLPALSQLGVASHVQVKDLIYIANTALISIPDFVQVGSSNTTSTSVKMFGNNQLGYLNLSVGGLASLNIATNPELSLELPNLTNAGNITVMNCSSISMTSLQTVSGFMNLDGNSISTISLPNLETIGSIGIRNNPNMDTLILPALVNIGGVLKLLNNSALQGIELPKLENVEGETNITGAFDSLVFPALTYANGMNVDTNQLFDCTRSSPLVQDTLNGIIQGNGLNCSGSNNTLSLAPNLTASHDTGGSPSTNTPAPTGTTSPSSPGLSTGTKIGIGIGIPIFILLIVFAFIFFRRRKSRKERGIPYPKGAEFGQGNHYEKAELDTVEIPGELETNPLWSKGNRREDGEGFGTSYYKPLKEVKLGELAASTWGPVPEAHELYAKDGNVDDRDGDKVLIRDLHIQSSREKILK